MSLRLRPKNPDEPSEQHAEQHYQHGERDALRHADSCFGNGLPQTVQHAFGGLERGLFFKQLTDCRHDHPLRDIRRGVLGGGNRRGDHTDAAEHAVQRTDQSRRAPSQTLASSTAMRIRSGALSSCAAVEIKIVDISYLHVFPRIVRNAR